jgi:RND family efflux transporter MFP subunit
MKNIYILIIASIITASCTEKVKNESLDSLHSKKSELVTQIDELNKELKAVEKEISKLDTSKKLPIITSIPVKNGPFKHYVEVQASVQADKNIEIRPELGGTINRIFVKEGQRVVAGQTLIQLDDATITNSINELKTQLALAKTTFERQERLWKQNIGSEMQYLQAKTQKETLENSLASLYTQAKKMKIIAPFSGIVDEIFPKKGELTSPQMPVVRLVNLDKVYINADVTETYLPVIKKGAEVLVSFPTLGNEIQSKISQIGNYINPENRSFKVRVNLDNKNNTIKPNLLADIKILDFEADGIIIPSSLVQQDQNGNDYVFTVTNENNTSQIVKKMIAVEHEYNHESFVTSGLTANDTLVNAGARLVKDGDEVKVLNN